MLFDVDVEIKIPGMDTSRTTLSLESPTLLGAIDQAQQSVTVTVLAVRPNDSGVAVSLPLEPVKLSKASAKDILDV